MRDELESASNHGLLIRSELCEKRFREATSEQYHIVQSSFLILHSNPIGTTMKKTFKLSHPKIKRPRLVEAIKYEVKKYIKRERRKTLPPKVDFWDFDCRFGVDEENCEVIHVSTINKCISQAEEKQLESFYLEILAKPGYRTKKPKKE